MRALLVELSPYMPAVTPISLGGLGAVLRERGHEVRVLSLGARSRYSPEGLLRFAREYRPLLLGFTAYQRNMPYVRAMARSLRRVLPELRVIIGGPQATFLPDAAIAALPEIDFVSRGEGEPAIAAVAEALEGGDEEGAVPGVTRRLPGGRCLTGSEPPLPDELDVYPSPWLSGILDPAATEESIMLGSRGCRACCPFCYTPAATGRRIRAHSVERVLEDIDWVARRGTGRLWFGDPNFSFSDRRVRAILEGILRRGLKVEMWIETRADMLDDELIRLARRAGVTVIAMGLESAAGSVVPALEKELEPATIAEAARRSLAAGIDVELFSQFALPGESLDDALETLRFVKGCGVKIRGNSNAQQMQLYFGAEIAARPGDYGIRPLRASFPPWMSVGAEFETDRMSRAEIELVREAWRTESLDGGKRVIS
jgi:radical SAM superfamily enzyme YgiQ (UPF0313 family)